MSPIVTNDALTGASFVEKQTRTLRFALRLIGVITTVPGARSDLETVGYSSRLHDLGCWLTLRLSRVRLPAADSEPPREAVCLLEDLTNWCCLWVHFGRIAIADPLTRSLLALDGDADGELGAVLDPEPMVDGQSALN